MDKTFPLVKVLLAMKISLFKSLYDQSWFNFVSQRIFNISWEQDQILNPNIETKTKLLITKNTKMAKIFDIS